MSVDQATRDRQIALGERMYNRGDLLAAAACFRLAVSADPTSAQAHAQLAWCLKEPEGTQDAVHHLRLAANLDQTSTKVRESLAKLLVSIGQFDEAEQNFQEALKISPQSATSLCGIVGCRKMRPEDRALIDSISQAAQEPKRPEKQRAHLHRAVGKALDDLGEYEAAIKHFDESNLISERIAIQSGSVFDGESLRKYTDLLIEVFTPDRFAQESRIGSDSELPVLIVGMIRSGTTLLDQLLNRHPSIASAGELNYWTGSGPGILLKEFLNRKMDPMKAHEVCAEYRILLRKAASSESRVIDKMPMNFLGIGLIHLLFPKARIIHCRRHPVDTGLSIYVTELGNPRPNFAVSRQNIVFMYRQYQRLMDHWRSVLPPGQFLEVDYESLVSHQEAELRRAVNFLGLSWDKACLENPNQTTVVTTPSSWQARQPIYATSVQRWRKYEPWLGELKDLMPV